MGDVYPLHGGECMVPGCPCPLSPSLVIFKVSDGRVFAWLCPCHFLVVLDAISAYRWCGPGVHSKVEGGGSIPPKPPLSDKTA